VLGAIERTLFMRSQRVHGSLRRWEDEGGAPLAQRRSRAEPLSPSLSDAAALYYFNIRTSAGTVDTDRDGLTLPDLTAALHEALALARQSLLEGDRKGRDRRHWQVEIMDRAKQHLLTVKFSEVATCELPPRPE
jgi:hypothetical protein